MSMDVKQKSLTAPDLRAKRVARTEAQLIEAASVLFCDQGYVATTLAQIAERAGVAARTVYVRFGTKAALFRRVIDQALVGDAEPLDVAHRPRVQDAMTAATLAERIEALADVSAGIAERAGPLFEVAAQSEGLEPELAEAAQAGRHATTQLCRSFWDQAAADGHLAEGLHPEHLTVVTDVLLCADTIVHIRRTHGWSAALHRSLIVETLTALTRRRA
jgi:AcrR family transcriptional regulator